MAKLITLVLLLAGPAIGSFSYTRSLTIDHTQCGNSDSSNFPVLVEISTPAFKTAVNGGHIQNTVVQSGGNAVTMPVYAANPMFALKTALDKHEALPKEFARKNNLDTNFVYVLDASESSRTPPKLQDLVARYQRLDEFLESAVQPQCAT